jgi:Spy/CpxP family protein refolding chaperone
MNIKTILPVLLFFVSFTFFAQGERMKEKKEQVKALKVAFFTTELDLTTSEAERFWPVYNTYDDKQFEIRHKKMKAFMYRMDNDALDKMSEKEASTLLSLLSNSEEDLFLLRKKLNNDLKEILPSVKIIKLKKAEDNFNRKLLHQYRDKGHK